MRKYTPYMILAIGLLALAIDLLPNLRLPDSRAPEGSRLIETKLGLDLRAGLRAYAVRLAGGVLVATSSKSGARAQCGEGEEGC